MTTVLLRPARPDDDAAVRRLAQLDGAPPPPTPALVAEEGGELRAVLSLSTGRAVADPFTPSAYLVALLREMGATAPARVPARA